MVRKINEMQAFVRLVKDAMMWQLNKLQVWADGEIFTVGNGQENLVAHRLAIRIGSFTRLRRLHVSVRQNNPPLYWVEMLETPGKYGLYAIRRGKRPPER
jgi:hypothetical protein